MKTVVLGIDLQYDFCNPKGSLYINGADGDVERIARLIRRNVKSIDAVIMSMDSHQPVHIAHQIYWKDKDGLHPDLFSTISKIDVEKGKWIPQYNQNEALDYLTKLENKGDVCTIWPPHCIIGTQGWSVEEAVFAAIEEWTTYSGNSYQLVNKGMYQSTEHYSIFKAAIEYPAVKVTLFNEELLDTLTEYNKILVVGEAADFCVANSLNDLLFKAPELASRIYMLEDCMSYIVEGNNKAKEIFDEARALGVVFCKSTDF